MPLDEPIIRIDWKTTKMECLDKEKGLYRMYSKPDPERYERVDEDGKKGFFDKFDNIFIPDEVIKKASESSVGLPIYYSPSKIRDSDEYIISRKESIERFLDGDPKESFQNETCEDFLESLDDIEMDFIILSIDLVESTKMSQILSLELNSKIIDLFLLEITLIINAFNGFVLKYTGDGLIAYFPDAYAGKHDNAIDSACTLKRMIIKGINPVLNDKNIPELEFRIGLDSGKAIKKVLGVKGIKTQTDLVGETVNIAVKIQEIAPKNQILIGASTAFQLHLQWRKRIKKLKKPKNWNYIDKLTNKSYQLFYLKFC